MSQQRKRYKAEFKQQIVKQIQEETKSLIDMSRELNIPRGTLSDWVAQYSQFERAPLPDIEKVRTIEHLLREQERELQENERQIADLKEEIAILKKAAHIFSKPKK